MATQTSPRLRETLGDEGVGELVTLVDERIRVQGVPRDEYQQVIIQLSDLDQRLGTLEREVAGLRQETMERFTRIDERFIEMDQHFEVRFEEMNRHFENRFDRMEERLEARIDRGLEEVDQRLDRMDQRLDRMDQRFDQMDQRFDQMYDRMLVQTRWLIGSIALLGTVISILLAIGLFVQ